MVSRSVDQIEESGVTIPWVPSAWFPDASSSMMRHSSGVPAVSPVAAIVSETVGLASLVLVVHAAKPPSGLVWSRAMVPASPESASMMIVNPSDTIAETWASGAGEGATVSSEDDSR